MQDVDTGDEPDKEGNGDTEPHELVFLRAGRHWSASEIKAGVAEHGQRGYQKLSGIPRTTLQEWIRKINNGHTAD